MGDKHIALLDGVKEIAACVQLGSSGTIVTEETWGRSGLAISLAIGAVSIRRNAIADFGKGLFVAELVTVFILFFTFRLC